MSVDALLASLGEEIVDPEEGTCSKCSDIAHHAKLYLEAFLLFSQSIPSQNLGFVDAKATVLDVTVGTRDLSIHQSPTILASNRGGGTTGAGPYFQPSFPSSLTSV